MPNPPVVENVCEHVTYKRTVSRDGLTYDVNVCKLCGHWSSPVVELSRKLGGHRPPPIKTHVGVPAHDYVRTPEKVKSRQKRGPRGRYEKHT